MASYPADWLILLQASYSSVNYPLDGGKSLKEHNNVKHGRAVLLMRLPWPQLLALLPHQALLGFFPTLPDENKLLFVCHFPAETALSTHRFATCLSVDNQPVTRSLQACVKGEAQAKLQNPLFLPGIWCCFRQTRSWKSWGPRQENATI